MRCVAATPQAVVRLHYLELAPVARLDWAVLQGRRASLVNITAVLCTPKKGVLARAKRARGALMTRSTTPPRPSPALAWLLGGRELWGRATSSLCAPSARLRRDPE
jgi:hypothetical protein